MENVYAEFKKQYTYYPGNDEPFCCCITLSLPADKNGNLIPILRDKKCVFDWWLSPNWGGMDVDNNMRYVTMSLKSSTSWDDLSREVDKLIEETTFQLKEIVFKNRHFSDTKPGDGVCVINLTKDF